MEIKNLENWRTERNKNIFGIISINFSFAILIGLSYYLSVDNIFVKQIVGIDLLLLAICVSLLTLMLIISKCFLGKYKFAKDLENNEAALIIEEKSFDKDELISKIDSILNDSKTYHKMTLATKKMGITDSATRIYKEIKKLCEGD